MQHNPAPLKLTREQATELSLLVELEARWENLRQAPSAQEVGLPAQKSLRMIQNAYDAFRSKLVAYNKRYAPAHVPELLLNTPLRLAIWCRGMRNLYLDELVHDPRIECPVALLEKAYRCAERMSIRMNQTVSRLAPPDSIRAAIDSLGALIQWCEQQPPPQ